MSTPNELTRNLIELKLKINQAILDQIFCVEYLEHKKMYNVKALFQAMNWVTAVLEDDMRFSENEMKAMVAKSMPPHTK